MKKIFSLPLILCMMILFVSNYSAQDVDSLLALGDRSYDEFDNEKALEIYKKADVKYPDNWRVLWRISRAHVDIGEHMPASTDEQEEAQIERYNLAYEYANRAVQLAPEQSLPYLRRAIANGRVALFKGVFSVADVVNTVRDDSQKAIELDNGGDENQAIAHYVLARTHAKISEKWAPARAVLGLGWADLDSALVHYQKAINLKPNFVMFYLDYAKALISDDNFEDAKSNLELAIKSPIEDEDDAKKIEEAKALLIEVNEELD